MEKTLKQFLTESTSKKVVFTFGRFNPVTTGHELLLTKILEIAKKENADVRIYLSQTQDPKKNPLSWKQKIRYTKLGIPNAAKYIQTNEKIKTPFDALGDLCDSGYKDVIMVAGSDRVSEYQNSIQKYVNNPKAATNFELDSFKVVSAGDRDPDAEGVSGVSASKMREAAAKNDLKTFKTGCPSGLSAPFCQKMMDDVRDGLDKSILKETITYIFETVLEPASHLGLEREAMPQIPSELIDGFFKHLQDKGITINLETEYPFELKPTQTEISLEKAKEMVQFGIDALPIIVSSDNYILDGHHRWLAQTQVLPIGHTRTVPIYRINLNIEELIQISNNYLETYEND